MTRNSTVVAALILMFALALPCSASAYWVDMSVGGWAQSPSGELGYKGTNLDLESDFGFESEVGLIARAKFDLPTPAPNFYLMATQMGYEGSNSLTIPFTFGDNIFSANLPFDSKLELNHYDLGIFYNIPLMETATLNTFNVDLGVNLRLLDMHAEVSQPNTNLSQSKDLSLPLPMLYLGVQVMPVDSFALELEGRGVAYSGNHYYDYIGRLKYKLTPATIAVGYRGEMISIDESDVLADVNFGGPFVEVGVQF